MQVILTAPFRTDINFDTRLAILEAEQTSSLLTECTKSTSSKGFRWSTLLAKTDSELQFNHLDDVCIPQTSQPSLMLEVHDRLTIEEVASKVTNPFIVPSSFKSIKVFYFDNTLALLLVEFKLSHEAPKLDKAFDEFTNALCAACIDSIAGSEHSLIEQVQTKMKQAKRKVFKLNGQYDIFANRDNPYSKCEGAKRLMWVSRVAFSSEDSPPTEISDWMRLESLSNPNFLLHNTKGFINVGNSLFDGNLSKEEVATVIDSYLICNYFYALFDIINKDLRSIFIDESVRKKTSNKTIVKITKTQEYVRFLNAEFNDYLSGIQGIHSKISKSLITAWKLKTIINSASEKIELITAFTKRITNEKRNKYNRIIESVLVAIAGVTLLQFTLEIFQYQQMTHTDTNQLSGVFNVVSSTPLDVALHSTIFIVIAISILVMRKR